MPDDLLQQEDLFLFDSGYTNHELDGIFKSLANGADLGWLDSFVYALVLGMCDGNVDAFAESGTVRLHTPRVEIDRRVAAVRTAMRDGATFQQAVCALPGE